MRALPVVAWRYWRAGQRLGHPLQVGFAVNNTCNTFCEMCNVWQMRPKTQLSLDEIRTVFGGPLFRHCATVSLTGGEPSMRRDFAELPPALAEVMPALRQVNLTSNGYATDAIVGGIERFVPTLRRRRIAFGVNLSIDGVGETHDRVRNNAKAWERLDATVTALASLRARLRFNLVLACTFTHSNVDDARAVLEYAQRHGVYVVFRRAAAINRIENADIYGGIAPTPEQDRAIAAFLAEVLEHYDRSHARRIYYRMLLRMMAGGARDVPCLYRKAGLFIDHVGDLYVCTVASKRLGNALHEDAEALYFQATAYRDEMASTVCTGCSHDVSLYTPPLHQITDRVRAAITKVKR